MYKSSLLILILKKNYMVPIVECYFNTKTNLIVINLIFWFFPTQTNSEQGGLLADYHHRNPRPQSQDVLQQSQLSCQ